MQNSFNIRDGSSCTCFFLNPLRKRRLIEKVDMSWVWVTLTPLPIDVGPIEAGKNMFGAFFVVPPGEAQEKDFLYELPSGVLERQGSISTYRLLVQKQPGTRAIPLRVTVDLPPGSEVLSARPAASSVGGGKVEFQTDLRVDRQFEISFRY